jgi:CheY-like chemotaxis protein
MLTEMGHSIGTVENGPAALTLLSTGAEFDLLLVDFAMPVMNGAQVAAEAIKQRPELSILFMTGYADAAVLSSWAASGYRMINKPFSAAELGAAISNVVAASSQNGNVVSLRRNRS